MAVECPANTVDEHAARIVATLVVVLAAASTWGRVWPLIALLAVDFTIRGFGNRRYSPLRWLAKSIVGALGWEPKAVYAPPKRFAAQIGSVLTIVATLLHAAGLHGAAIVFTMLLIVAASLEAVVGSCLACWVYPYMFRLRPQT
jgi:enamine deaminase RidA (YjgF/YER057c/UK114 family)